MRTAGLVLGLLLSLTDRGLSQVPASVDSVVLRRKETLCLGACQPIPDVLLRRGKVPSWMMDTIGARAETAGFYQLPNDMRGVPWCEVILSDQVMALLSIYRGRTLHTLRGYHDCIGRKTDVGDAGPPERQRLLDLEALIDSVGSRKGRFR
jgi:hypothetical protein